MILTVSSVGSGGTCIGHADDGRVVFVRYALPGETVRVEVTSTGSKFLRADAVEVLSASPDRVPPRCGVFGVCGGCDWQHASPAAQLALKTSLVRDQLARIGGYAWDGAVEAVAPSWGWRTRMQWAGGVGLHGHRSAAVVPVSSCPIAVVGEPPGPLGAVVEVTAVDGQQSVAVNGRGSGGVRVAVRDRRFEVAAGGFWQVHVAAATTLVDLVLEGLDPQPGQSCLDLYAGAGLFAAFLGAAVGPSGSVLAVEASSRACADAARNTDDLPWVRIRTEGVTARLVARQAPDLVVLDPPRAGAGLEVTAALAVLRPRRMVYVSCDAASFARDLRVLLDAGWTVPALRVLDLYPQTEHVELVCLLAPPP